MPTGLVNVRGGQVKPCNSVSKAHEFKLCALVQSLCSSLSTCEVRKYVGFDSDTVHCRSSLSPQIILVYIVVSD